MKTNIKKKLQSIFKKITYNIFFLFYGKIKGIIKASSDDNVKIKKTTFHENFNYRIYNIKKCRLYTDAVTDAAFIVNNKIVDEPSFQFRDVKNAYCDKNIVFEKGTPRYRRKIKGTVFSLLTGGAGNDNYWHWMFDVLPRIGIVQNAGIYEDINYFLFPDTRKKFQRESLDLLNIDPNKRLSSLHYRHVLADTFISVDHPYVLKNDATNEITNIPKWIIDWLKKEFSKKLENNKSFPDKFYIDRNDSTSERAHLRKIINEQEVKDFLEKNNYKSITLANLNFIDQVNLFKKAKSIVGLHGAGFANTVFCFPKTKILELKPHSSGDVIKNLCIANDLIFSEISIKTTSNNNNDQFGHIEIPINVLEKKLMNKY